MQAEWMGYLPEVILRWAQNVVTEGVNEKALEAEMHINIAVAKA
jgi:hypothetical protein